jgi:hypothetical protein
MKIMGFRPISRMFALLFCMLFAAAGYCEEYQVKMQDGRVLRVKSYYEKEGTVFLLRYGNYIGVEKSTIAEIVKVHDLVDITKPKAVKNTGAGAKTAVPSTLKNGKNTARPGLVAPKTGQPKAPETKSVKEEPRQRAAQKQLPEILDTNRLREMGELDQTISRLRTEKTKTCSASETPSGNTASRCKYLTSQIDELEKKLQRMKAPDGATTLDKSSSKTESAHKSQKGS